MKTLNQLFLAVIIPPVHTDQIHKMLCRNVFKGLSEANMKLCAF